MQDGGTQWFEAMGMWGPFIVLLTSALLLAIIVCTAVRVPRGAAVALLLASFLPVLFGLTGMLHGLIVAAEVIATLTDASPRDIAAGTYESEVCLMAGLAGTLACWAVALVSLVRSRALEPAPELAAA